ncbi:hypothetical protein SmJEL517_g04433 [Synchytrium microbalum]|uniref:ABC1 atypical kinase-like domain-containing protein n=1 Tax=Synchytrium microbalum TaxID=1806994 RepID=A0A507BYD7_9FUNG|nr:uncharacterized protein SmJEL517_g04433 [Synchytrium microbalum]TPX32442.1 hypothetical protein SmJEL517_g04433 [Synchytrium microbalum]
MLSRGTWRRISGLTFRRASPLHPVNRRFTPMKSITKSGWILSISIGSAVTLHSISGLVSPLNSHTIMLEPFMSATSNEPKTVIYTELVVPKHLPIRVTLFRILYLVFNFLPVVITFPLWWWFSNTKTVNHIEWNPSSESWWLSLLRYRMEHGGVLFIKLAQWISSRYDVFPPDICYSLSRLQSRVTAHSLQHTKQSFKSSFGIDMDIVINLNETPIGIGAIGQVYKGVLKADGEAIAIKVLHPGILEPLLADLYIITCAAQFLDRFSQLKPLSLPEEVETFAYMLLSQLDLRIEAENYWMFKRNLKGWTQLRVPDVRKNWIAKDVLVESLEPGVHLRQVLGVGKGEFDHELLELGVRAFLQMCLKDNFGHADLHPSNILITFTPPLSSKSIDTKLVDSFLNRPTGDSLTSLYEAGYKPRLTLVDCGIVSNLSEYSLMTLKEVFAAGIEFDGAKIGSLLVEKCRSPQLVKDPTGFKTKVAGLFQSLKLDNEGQLMLSQVHTGLILEKFMALLREHHLHMPGDFAALAIAAVLVEGCARRLRSDIDLVPLLTDYL